MSDDHFTYEPVLDRSRLHQGDLISRTPQVVEILQDIHQYYCTSTTYKNFIVLTQSCDLVRHNGESCKANYITIAAVRPLELVVDREAQAIAGDPKILEALGVLIGSDTHQGKLRNFVESLFNNNQSDYFFLAANSKHKIDRDYCAFLKLSVALKSEFHYDTLLAAKVAQLTPSFQHKLGYLVGNSYSRIGTEDWVPNSLPKPDFEKKITSAVKKVRSVEFLQKEAYDYICSHLESPPVGQDLAHIVAEYTKMQKEEKENRFADVLSIVEEELCALLQPLADSETPQVKGKRGIPRKLVNRLKNSPQFKSAVK